MTDKKLTDAEIVKVLECCVKGYCETDDCPYKHIADINTCTSKMAENALDLINRLQVENEKNENIIRIADKTIGMQQAEIEKLKVENRILSQKRINLYERLEIINNARAEAIKEFAERLKEKQVYNYEWECMLVDVDDIDNLLKEMVGDN